MNIQHVLKVIVAVTLATSGMVVAQQDLSGPRGIFAGSSDVGKTRAGSTAYEPSDNIYRVTGGGADMWGDADAFHFSWVRLSGDATLTADVHFPSGSLAPLEKAVLIFRQSLDPDSAYADVAIHADGHITLQWRASQGAVTQDATAAVHNAASLSIIRRHDHFTALAAGADGKLAPFASIDIPLKDPVYAGIGVCAH